MRQLIAEEFGVLPGDFRETTGRVRSMLEQVTDGEETELVFGSGVYHFYPDYAPEKLLYISNHNEDTIKKIAFDLEEKHHLRLCGNSAVFLFHTDIIPFYLRKCEDVEIEGITIDYQRPAYSQGKIIELEKQRMVLSISPKEYPYRIMHGKLYFEEECGLTELYSGCLEMDEERHAPVCQGRDISFNRPYSSSYGAFFREAGEGLVEITLTGDQEFLPTSRVGNDLILRHHWRTHPCFYVLESKDTILKDITIYHCTGMAVIGQFTENMMIERVNLIRHPKKQRVFTATADGFHFVYGKGTIHIKDCFLENQLDDPVNIHGIYGRIHKVISDREVLVELVEPDQKGVCLGYRGDSFAVLDNRTMLEKGWTDLEEITMLNRDYIYMKWKTPIPMMKKGFVVENKSYVANVIIEGCTFRNNRARGLLLTSAGDVLVQNNRFEVPGAAILIEGDSNYWFESGATRHIVVRHNKFVDCSYVGGWGKAPIQVSPSACVWEDEVRYHKYLELSNNTFICFDDRLVNATNLERLVIKGNQIIRSHTFPPVAGKPLELTGVLEVESDLEITDIGKEACGEKEEETDGNTV